MFRGYGGREYPGSDLSHRAYDIQVLLSFLLSATLLRGPSSNAPNILLVGGDAAEARALQKRANVYTMPDGPLDQVGHWLGFHAIDLVVYRGQAEIPETSDGSPVPFTKGPVPQRIGESALHRVIDLRQSRTPRDLAEELLRVYGQDFDSPVYIPAMSLIARLRMGELDEVAALAAPYIDGRKDSLAKATGSHYAGHLLFAELADRTKDKRYMDRVRAAAELFETNPQHNEMSDSVFMGCPLLAAAGKYDAAVRHFEFMQKLCLRPDGLYRHSPLSEAAWGRGNAFPALGLSWTLLRMPARHPGFLEMRTAFQKLIATLAKYQDDEGMWHEVIDRPDSYAEYSATAMIATAMHRGVIHGWLARTYEPRVQSAWRAILARTGAGGSLVDVCESTGKQKTLEDYLNRKAINGKDARGGGMALLLATELIPTAK